VQDCTGLLHGVAFGKVAALLFAGSQFSEIICPRFPAFRALFPPTQPPGLHISRREAFFTALIAPTGSFSRDISSHFPIASPAISDLHSW
jgi:hypothetical protein